MRKGRKPCRNSKHCDSADLRDLVLEILDHQLAQYENDPGVDDERKAQPVDVKIVDERAGKLYENRQR